MSAMLLKVLLLSCLVAALISVVLGHGYLLEPVNRGSLWRFDPSSPANYEDNQQFCGGIGPQWNTHNGKCGICGDNFGVEIPRPHENTGVFGEGKIVANYTKGQIISATVLLSANHKGWFQFSICPLMSKETLETEDCFQNITLANGDDIYKLDTKEPGDFRLNLQLPEDLVCGHCVFRWHWMTANNWGTCSNGEQAVGCGPQETYRNCADVSISA